MIISNNVEYLSRGGKFLIPLPEIRLLNLFRHQNTVIMFFTLRFCDFMVEVVNLNSVLTYDLMHLFECLPKNHTSPHINLCLMTWLLKVIKL